jgi:hypothetical protein
MKEMTGRDIYQRKANAICRMTLAINRWKQATSSDEKEKASYGIRMWRTVSRSHQFKLGNGGVDRRKPRSQVNSCPTQNDTTLCRATIGAPPGHDR